MVSLYKRSFHSFLGWTANPAGKIGPPEPPPPCKCGLGLITLSASDQLHRRGPNILESCLVKTPPPRRPPEERRDPGGIGFLDAVEGLTSCTESLGFESYDVRRADDEIDDKTIGPPVAEAGKAAATASAKRRRTKKNVVVSERNKKFPPRLSSLNGRGQRCFYLRPVRKDGKLEISLIRIQRPEILCASREDGRLRLHLVDDIDNPIRACNSQENREPDQEHQECNNQKPSPTDFDKESSDNTDTSIMKYYAEIDQNRDSFVEKTGAILDPSVRKYGDDVDCEKLGQEERQTDDEDNVGGDDGFHDDTGSGDDGNVKEWRHKRCHDVVMNGSRHHHDYHHHHQRLHNMHLWGQQCVTTR